MPRITRHAKTPPDDRFTGALAQQSSSALLLAAEHAVDIGARVLIQGRSHIGALIAKGDRDFATTVDLQIESAIRRSLGRATPGIPFLGEEQGGESDPDATQWVLDPIDGTINFAKDSPLCTISLSLIVAGQPLLGIVDAPLLGERFLARDGAGAYLNGTTISVSEVDSPNEAMIGLADSRSASAPRMRTAYISRCSPGSLTRACAYACTDPPPWISRGWRPAG
jgi:fructose-1,6-bisphosphatase/inositol monophosphatase family enzyme